MRDSNYLSVGYATLGSLELRPPFTSPSIRSFHPSFYLSGTGQTSVPLLHLTILQRHVFLLNSCPPRLCATLLSKSPSSPMLRGHFAEFLINGYPQRLRLRDVRTCVGLQYGFVLLDLSSLFLNTVFAFLVHSILKKCLL